MNQPTFQQIGDLYHALWEYQRELEESENKAQAYKSAYSEEEEYTFHLKSVIDRAREYLKSGNAEKALEVLNQA